MNEKLHCGQCKYHIAKRYSISDKDVRILCEFCIEKNRRRDDVEKPNFVKASKLR